VGVGGGAGLSELGETLPLCAIRLMNPSRWHVRSINIPTLPQKMYGFSMREFPPIYQRKEIEQTMSSIALAKMDKDQRATIVIATQIIEQSLDLDFDLLVSSSCSH
jgi:hypothetical protein